MGRASSARRARKSGQKNRYKKPYVWGGGVDLDFSVDEWTELNRFVDAVNSTGDTKLSREHVCKQAVFMSIQSSYRRAHEMEMVAEEEKVNGQPTSPDISRDSEAVSPSEVVDSNLVAEASASGDQVATT